MVSKIFTLILCCCTCLAAEEIRIFSASSAANHLLITLGAKERLTAIEEFGRIVPGTEGIPVIGRGSAVSLEKLVELGVTHALLWDYQEALAETLTGRNIAVHRFPAGRLADYPETVRTVARLAGREKEGEAAIRTFQTVFAAPPPAALARVYFELYSAGQTPGRESYLADLLRQAGADSLGNQLARTGKITPERIALFAPEVIFFIEGSTTREEIAARPGFAALPAVRNRRIIPINRLYTVEGADPVGAIRFLKGHL